MDAIERLGRGLAHTGEAPFGSCFQQAAINVLDALGLSDAQCAPGIAWGTSWRGQTPRLRAGGRWAENLEEACGLRVNTVHTESWVEAQERESEFLQERKPVIAGVDSFGIPSPHRGRNHLVHALIVLASDDQAVTACDPMNNPHPARVELQAYAKLRSADCVERYEMIACEGELTTQLDPAVAVKLLARDVARHGEEDDTALCEFTSWIEANCGAGLDVADVGAERLYMAKLLRAAANGDRRLVAHAKSIGSLARRWYLLHTLAIESAQSRSFSTKRIVELLKDLRRRECEERAALLSTVQPEVAEAGCR